MARSKITAILPWLLAAVAVHGAVLLVLEKSVRQDVEYDVAAGQSSTEMDIAPEPPAAEPAKPAAPPPVPAPPPKPDEMALPTPVPAVHPPSEEKPRVVTHAPPVHIRHPSTSAASGHAGHAGATANAKAGILQNPAPPYPESAREDREEGVVQLMVSIDAAGRVLSVRLVRSSGYPDLDQSAMHTVRTQWRFTPARPSELVLPVRFRLSD